MILNLVMNFIYDNHKHCLEKLGQDLLSPLNLQLYADSVHAKEAPLHNCRSFIEISNPHPAYLILPNVPPPPPFIVYSGTKIGAQGA